MRLPYTIASNPQATRLLGLDADVTGNVRVWPASNGVYPPAGYLPWTALAVGNGDTYGYYWPVGHEERDPIVCTTEHDACRAIPLAADLAGCLRVLRAAEPEIVGELDELAHVCGVSLTDARRVSNHAPAQTLFGLDPQSPWLLLAVAREAMRSGDLAICEHSLIQALGVLPEYGEAAFVLGQLYRRQRRFAQAAQAMLDAITSPLCFAGGHDLRLKSLRALQGMRDDLLPGDDVLWRERRRLIPNRHGVLQHVSPITGCVLD